MQGKMAFKQLLTGKTLKETVANFIEELHGGPVIRWQELTPSQKVDYEQIAKSIRDKEPGWVETERRILKVIKELTEG